MARASHTSRAYWLIKSEPRKYSWDDLVRDGKTHWDGIRNYEARNNLAAMQRGDLAFYYHSNTGKQIVGIVEIVGTAYQDPTTEDETWVAVDIAPCVAFGEPVSLATIKGDSKLSAIQLVTRGRLSVVPISNAEFRHVAKLGKTKIPAERTQTAKSAPRGVRAR